MIERPESSNRQESIQILRAIACIAVLQIHFMLVMPILGGVTYAGAIGVDLFFIISGYIIAMSLEKTRDPRFALRFLVNRIARVVPYYWLLTLLLAGLMAIGAYRDRVVGLGETVLSLLFIPTPPKPVIFVGWTLSHEILFYGVCALTAIVVGRKLWIIAGAFASVLFFVHILPDGHYWSGFFKASVNWEFFFGFVSYLVRNHLSRVFKADALIAIAIILFFVVPLFSTDWELNFGEFEYPRDRIVVFSQEMPRLFGWGIPSLLLFLVGIAHETEIRRLSLSWLVKIGNASYSIYLMQAFVILLDPFVRGLNPKPRIFAGIGMIVATILLGLWARRLEDACNGRTRNALARLFLGGK